jgi:branched-chain amino acid transport system ATP-binding protein
VNPSAPAEPFLSIRGLTAGYSGTAVLHGIDLDVPAGGFGAVLGTNGAGKTTLLRSIMGLVEVHSGEVRIGGEQVTGASPSAQVRRGVALVPEGRRLFGSLTVRENLLTGAVAGRRRDRAERLEAVLAYFPPLAARLDVPGRALSGGEQQMAAVGRALMSGPRLLLVDEASLGLAPIVVRGLFELLARVHEDGTTVLAVEQHLGVVAHADHVVVLAQGTVELQGPAAGVVPSLRREVVGAYLGKETP